MGEWVANAVHGGRNYRAHYLVILRVRSAVRNQCRVGGSGKVLESLPNFAAESLILQEQIARHRSPPKTGD